MKKLIWLLILILCLTSCAKKQDEVKPSYPYEIVSEKVDMSAYEGVSSTDHNFRLIRVSELYNTIDQLSSGVFYLGRSNCSCCQMVTRYLNETAKELGVTVYYIDVYDTKEPLSEKENYDRLYGYLYDILGTGEDGEKALLTPHAFSIVNGKFYGSQICHDNYKLDPKPSEAQVEKFKESYRSLMKPFTEE